MERFAISRHPTLYHAWPDVALAADGRLVCVFSECTHHGNRDHTRVMLTDSRDRGRTWSAPRPLTEGTRGLPYYYNCARISRLADGRLAVTVDRVEAARSEKAAATSVVTLRFSDDLGERWSEPTDTPVRGIVPDKLLELPGGRWLLAAHYPHEGFLTEFLRYSDDRGRSWSEEITLAHEPGLHLCEVSILPLPDGTLAALLRENSGVGRDAQKTLSRDGGLTWSPVAAFPLPGCHRPVAGWLRDGRALITYRFMQGGKGWLGRWTQNFMGAFTDEESLRAAERAQASTRIFPIDYDRSPHADLGYSGWVEFPDGEVYVVQYLVDDAFDKGQIRGYAFRPEEFLLPPPAARDSQGGNGGRGA